MIFDVLKNISAERISVYFNLEREDEDWPPAGSEGIWAIVLSPDVARVDSIPWFVQNIALGDLISVRQTPEGRMIFLEKLKWSGSCTLRVIPLADDSEVGIRDTIDRLSGFGIEIEVLEQFGIVAVNAHPSVDLVQLKRMLDLGEERGWWNYDEGCVGGAWP